MVTKGRLAGAALVLLFVAALLAVFAPAMVVKAGPRVVTASFVDELGFMLDASASCKRLEEEVFRCTVSNEGSSFDRYRLEVTWTGCWDAKPHRDSDAEPLEGCINIWDL